MYKNFEKDDLIDFISSWINVVDENSKILGVKEAWKNMHPWQN